MYKIKNITKKRVLNLESGKCSPGKEAVATHKECKFLSNQKFIEILGSAEADESKAPVPPVHPVPPVPPVKTTK